MRGRVRLAHGCYITDEDAGLAERCASLLSVSPTETVVAGLAAATLHGLWLPEPATVPEIAIRQSGRRSASMNRSHRSGFPTHRRQILDRDVVLIDGLPVTGLARTWWDLATQLELPDLVAAGDRALQIGCSTEDMGLLIQRQTGGRGNVRAKQALRLLDVRSRSRPETHLRVAVRQAGLDCFDVNTAVHDRYGGWLGEPDLACSSARLALEYQGAGHAEIAQMRKDITRAADFRRNGWLVLYYGPGQVFGRPWEIGPELRHLIQARAPHLLTRVRP